MDFSKFFFAFPVEQANQFLNQHVPAHHRGRGNRGGRSSRDRRSQYRHSRYERYDSRLPKKARYSSRYENTNRGDESSRSNSRYASSGERDVSDHIQDRSSESNITESTSNKRAGDHSTVRSANASSSGSDQGQSKTHKISTSTNKGKERDLSNDATTSGPDGEKETASVADSINGAKIGEGSVSDKTMIKTFPTFKVANLRYKKQDLAYMVDDTDLPTKSDSMVKVSFIPNEQADPKTMIEINEDTSEITAQQIKTAREEFEKEEQKKKGSKPRSERIKQRAIVSPSIFTQLPQIPK